MSKSFLFLSAVLFLMVADEPKKEAVSVEKKKKLWAGISVSEPIIALKKGMQTPTLFFGLINAGDTTVDPEVGSSTLLVNGKVPKNWDISINQGPRDKRWQALPPGDNLRPAIAFFEELWQPGIYKVKWKGKHFESAEIVFRVIREDNPN
jgi:hypothetical protein